jgi:transposase
MPPDMREWLPADHPVWLVIAAVGQLDTSAVHAHRRTGGVGRAGYHPDMLLTLLMWAWAQGVRSSRRIERACEQDIAFRVICAGDVPDHVTISRFRAETASAMESVFEQVLMLCAKLGMARLGVVALDGVKIGSNASMSANRTEEGLVRAGQDEQSAAAARAAAREASAEHAAADAADDDLFGPDDRGDQVPPDAVDPSSRAARIATALADLQAEKDAERAAAKAKGEAYLARRESGHSVQGSRPPPGVDVQIARERVAQVIAEREEFIADYWRRRRAAEAAGTKAWARLPRPVEQHQAVIRCRAQLAKAEARQAKRDAAKTKSRRVRNTTDPQSRMMPLRGGGWLQGYNCQAVTSEDGVIIAVSVNNNPSDVVTYIAMTDAAVNAAELIDKYRPTAHTMTTATTQTAPDPGIAGGIGIVLADAGYLSEENLTAPGPDRLIAVGKSYTIELDARAHPEEGPPPQTATAVQAMAHRLRTPEGNHAYRQRSHIAETPFGQAKHNLGFRRFTSRGQTRAAAEWNFHAAVNNLLKAISTGRLRPTPHPTG